uniref:LRIM1/APL1C-like dimerization domain-containing protein n=1 Tax=Anopheles epiroticus TaxID=199890 RepID=A0A182PFY4_9DIPT
MVSSLQGCTVLAFLLCVTSTVVQSLIHEIKQQGTNKFKIEKVTDANLRQALLDIRSKVSPSNVKELDLSGNPLIKISADDLAPFTNLELLNLSTNVFTETVDLQSLSRLRTVDLNSNYVERVLVGPAIETIYAANNNISLVACQGAGPGTRRFHLAKNTISSLLDLTDGCRARVEYLDLKLNEIDTLDFGELASSSGTLQHLNLQYNFIFDIKNRGNVVFSQLQTVDLSGNKLAFMGPELNAISNARSINLSNNKLVLISPTLVLSPTLSYFDLSGNGFQCDTLRMFFRKNAQLKKKASPEGQSVTCPMVGPYCCEEMTAPFADRLIDLKRKEITLFSDHGSERERAECERENRARQQEIEAMEHQSRAKVDEATRRLQAKIQLEQKKKSLEEQVSSGRRTYDEMDRELKETVAQIGLTDTPGKSALDLLHEIQQWYQDSYTEQQSQQNAAIQDENMYQQKESLVAEENARLKKLNGEANQALERAKAEQQTLSEREQQLAKILEKAKTGQQAT